MMLFQCGQTTETLRKTFVPLGSGRNVEVVVYVGGGGESINPSELSPNKPQSSSARVTRSISPLHSPNGSRNSV